MPKFGKGGTWQIDHSLDHVKMRDSDTDSVNSYGKPDTAPIVDFSGELETPEEKKARKRSHMIAYTTMFVMSIGFSIVLSGVWPYLKQIDDSLEKSALGWVVAANPLGQMVASPLLGLWGNKAGSIRGACMTTIVFFIGGNVMYASLYAFEGSANYLGYYMMIVARFIVGVSSANVTLCRSYLAGSTTMSERTTGIAVIAAAQAMGFVVGPGIQAILTVVVDGRTESGIPGLVWDQYTAAGWVAAILGFINLVIVLPCFFQEYYIAEKEFKLNQKKNPGAMNQELPKPNYWGVAAACFAFGIVIYMTSVRETIATPLVTDQYGITDDKGVFYVSMALCGAGFLSTFIFLGTAKLTKHFDERFVMIFFGFVPVVLGTFAHYPIGNNRIVMADCNSTTTLAPVSSSVLAGLLTESSTTTPPLEEEGEICLGCPLTQEWCWDTPQIPPWQLITSFLIAVIGYPVAMSLSQTVFSKILGPTPQGVWMGVLTMCGSLARVTGPLWISAVYEKIGSTPTYLILGGLETLATVVLLLSYKNLVPMNVQPNRTANSNDGTAEDFV